ncbi:hypothetical protein EDC01DRAFT_633696 [Geopyxis carbonaria]|nr:hypothetical protein EDC01DRAFT_633696 [Geopyxis carbonaria]
MLDAFFAGRRRPSGTPPVTSAATVSHPYHDSEHLMEIYPGSRPPLPRSNDSYASNRSSIAAGEARKSLVAYMDSDSYSYTSGAGGGSSRPGSRRGTVTQHHRDGHPPGSGFLASVWALGRYFYVSCVDSSREVVNDVVTLAAGFQRERRSTYAQSMGSSANIDDFTEEEAGETGAGQRRRASTVAGVADEEGRFRDRDGATTTTAAAATREALLTADGKGKLREEAAPRDDSSSQQPAHQHYAGEASAAARQEPAMDFQFVNYDDAAVRDEEKANDVAGSAGEAGEVAEAEAEVPVAAATATVVPEIENMTPTDERPLLSRHHSKSRSNLRTSTEAAIPTARRVRSLSEMRDADKETRKEEIKAMLAQATSIVKALKTKTPSPSSTPPAVPPKSEERSIPSPLSLAASPKAEVPAAPQTPERKMLRRSSVSSARSSAHGFPLDEVSLRQRPQSHYSFTSPVDEADDDKAEPAVEEKKAPEAVPEERKPSADLQDYSRALSSMLLNPSKAEPVRDDDSIVAASTIEGTPTPSVTVTAPVREIADPLNAKGEEVEAALEKKTETVEAVPEPSVASPAPVAEEAAQKLVEQPATPVPAPIEVDTTEPPIEAESVTVTPEPATPVKAESSKAPSVKSTSMEKKVINAFRRDSIRRGMSVFTPKKKSKDSPDAPDTDVLTPPPTPPASAPAAPEDGGSISERPPNKSRMSGVFSFNRKNKEFKEVKDADATSASSSKMERRGSVGAESALADMSKELAADTVKPTLQKKPSYVSLASEHRDSGPLSPVVEVASPKFPTEEPKSEPAIIADTSAALDPVTKVASPTPTDATDDDPRRKPLRRPTFKNAFSSSSSPDKTSRRASFFGGKKDKDKDVVTPEMPDTASVAPSESPSAPKNAVRPSATPEKASRRASFFGGKKDKDIVMPDMPDTASVAASESPSAPATARNAVSSSETPEKISRRASFFGGKKDKDIVMPDMPDTASVAVSESPSAPADKPKLFRKGTLRTPSFGLSKKDKDKDTVSPSPSRPGTSAGANLDAISVASSSMPPDDSPTKPKLFSNKTAMRVATFGMSGRDKDKAKDSSDPPSRPGTSAGATRPVTSAGPASDVVSIADSARSDKPKFLRRASVASAVNAFSSSSAKKEKAAAAAAASAAAGEPSTPSTPTKDEEKDKPKLFRKGTLRTPSFGLAKAGRSVSSSAVSLGSGKDSLGITMEEPMTPTPAEKGENGKEKEKEKKTPSKGAARMKGLVRASTFMGRSSKKGKEKEVV